MSEDRQSHWERVYAEKSEAELSWHQEDPALSLALAERAGISAASSVIDIGAGRSRLTEALWKNGLRDLTVLDLSAHALDQAKARLGEARESVAWLQADITNWQPLRRYDLWHDRAVFHFLTDPADRAAYLDALHQALTPGAHAIIATFAPDGPEKCSGLPVMRYSPDELARTLGAGFTPITAQSHKHVTPWGREQSFQYSLLRRV